jgi:hypothetical protein
MLGPEPDRLSANFRFSDEGSNLGSFKKSVCCIIMLIKALFFSLYLFPWLVRI